MSLDKEKEIKLQFVNAHNIYPLTYDNHGITECAFISDKTVFNKETMQTEVIRDVQTHTLDDTGNYVIRNFEFIASDGEELREIPAQDVPTEIFTGTNFRWFVPIKPNVVNNIQLDSPLLDYQPRYTFSLALKELYSKTK